MTQSFQRPDYPHAASITDPTYSEPPTRVVIPAKGLGRGERPGKSAWPGAAEAGQHVTEVAKDQATAVASETGRQARDLLRQAQSELAEQAGAQQQKVAAGLRSIGEELTSMSGHDGDKGSLPTWPSRPQAGHTTLRAG